MHQIPLKGWLAPMGAPRARASRVGRAIAKRLLPLLGFALLCGAEAVAADYGYTLTPQAADPGASISLAGEPLTDAAPARAPSPEPASSANPAANPNPPSTSPPEERRVRLAGHTLAALDKAVPLAPNTPRDENKRLTLTFILKRDDQAGFDRYLKEVYDPDSVSYRHFLTQAQIAGRFGPSREAYRSVLRELRQEGFVPVATSKSRLTLTVRGKRSDAERAFDIHIQNYRLGARRFYANDQDPALSIDSFYHVQAITGLSNLAAPRPAVKYFPNNPAGQALWYALCMNAAINGGSSALTGGLGIFFPAIIPELTVIALFLFLVPTPLPSPIGNTTAFTLFPQMFKCANVYNKQYGLSMIPGADPPAPAWQGVTGVGQTIGLAEFDTYDPTDVANYVALMDLPATAVNNVKPIHVNGGAAAGPNEDEVLLDIADILSGAPGAKVSVYDAPFAGPGSFQAVFSKMIDDKVNIISNSWAYCEDQTTLADVQSIDAVLQTAAASGITVLSGAGDDGSTCLDGSADTISVPADSPHITAVGGTSLTIGPGFTYRGETWWDGSQATIPTGQGGFGTSKFFTRPSYQNGLNTGSMRSVPDVSTDADPANGVYICQASAGGCPTGNLYGGTSSAAPEWAAYVALLNQAQGSNLGFLNPLVYPLAGTSAFHSAASMQTDFAHVGLGSPNLSRLHQALTKQTAGPPSTTVSMASAYLPNTYMFPHTLAGSLPLPDFADGSSPAYLVVNLADANGNTLSGKSVTISANSGSHAVITPSTAVTSADGGSAVFTVTDLTSEIVTFTATDTTDGVTMAQDPQVAFVVPIAAGAGISANPSAVPADGQTPATIIVTMKDSLNRPTPGKTVTISDGGAHAVIAGPTPSVTDANGQIQFSATDQINEDVTFTAVDVTDGNLPVPGSAAVTYSGSVSTACGVGVAPVAAAGYTITPYITGLPAAATVFYQGVNFGCPGGNNPAFTTSGTVWVTDFLTGAIYQTGLSGGAASSGNLLNTLTPALGTPIYGKDGSLYATLGGEGGEIVQLDAATGAIARVVASNLTCPAGLAVDPLSGDLFFDDECTNGGTDNASVWRIIDPANTDASKPTSVMVYATLPTTPNGGMAFAPNGTLYAVSGYYYSQTAAVEQVSGTNSATVTVTPVTGITSDYAVAIGTTNSDGSAQSLVVEPSGNLSEVPIANPGAAVVLATGGPGVGVTGPDGCLYSVHYDTVYRLAGVNGNCSFTPTSPAPSIKLTPGTVAPNPVQGTSQSLTATVRNVSSLAGVAVYFKINGANHAIKMVQTDSTGKAVLTYTSILAGSDDIVAGAVTNGTVLTSNHSAITWTAGKHSSFLTLNLSAHGGTVNQPVNVTATLLDLSVNPTAVVPAQSVTFTLGGSSCTAVTNSKGTATCQIKPSSIGAASLGANFSGNSDLAAASTSLGFNVSAPPTPPPTVKIAASPTNVAAGGEATLTWSSTNATACTASGSWSGSQATSGSRTETPTATGSYTYTLTCAGDGGSAAASAVLSATLVSVTVTAKSGGGSFSVYLSLCLGLLVILRLRRALAGHPIRTGRGRSASTLAFLAVATLAALASLGTRSAQAQQVSAASSPPAWFDAFYAGIRVGSMPVRLDSGKIDAGLVASGFSGVAANTDTSGVGGTVYLGYEFAPHVDIEFGFTHRNDHVATLSGAVASTANVPALLQSTAGLIRGYGNIYSLSFRSPFEIIPRFTIAPRVGAFVWATEVTTVAAATSFSETHEGGGVTVGLGAAYRVWRGLEVGVGVDQFRGSPNNIATLYGGSLEWRFGN
jgi:hypothetical protein